MSNYDFDANQFLDSITIDRCDVDKFFDHRKTENELMQKEVEETVKQKRRVTFKSAFEDEENIDPQPDKCSLGQFRHTPSAKKEASGYNHVGDRDSLSNILQNLEITNVPITAQAEQKPKTPLRASQMFEGLQLPPSSTKKHKMKTRNDTILKTPTLILRNRSIVRPTEGDSSTDSADDSMVSAVSTFSCVKPSPLVCNKRQSTEPAETTFCRPTSKFIGLAEQVARFHRETPDRFRSKPHQRWRPTYDKVSNCIPKSPMLATSHRHRPVNYPSRDEREEMIYEEMKKYQIKANPLNAKLFQGVSLGLKAPVEKRPPTRPEPFNLTKVEKAKPVAQEAPFQFKAQPVPRKILQSPVGVPSKKVLPVTSPHTPHITKPRRVASTPMSRDNSVFSNEPPCKAPVLPFSFENRDKLAMVRKEEKIKKILEEEKKGFSSFKAQPIRAFRQFTPLKTHSEPKKTVPVPFNLTKPKEKQETEVKIDGFKARPAVVLQKPAFFPRYSEHESPQIEPFEFKTAQRAEDWKRIQERLIREEEEYKHAKAKKDEEEMKRIAEEIKRLRRQAEFKAKPIMSSRPFVVHASDVKLTEPKAPIFRSGSAKSSTEKLS